MEKPDQTTDRETNPVYRREGRSLGLVYENINVHAVASGVNGILTMPALLGQILQWPVGAVARLTGKQKTPTREILRDASGALFPGETMLVLGRPGAGTSTMLKVLANSHESFHEVQGQLHYAGMASDDMARWYRSETVYASENDIHFSTLPVKDAMGFAFRLRKPASDPRSASDFALEMTDASLKSVGLSHTANTIVGDAFVRGVSGGERKRVTLIEALSVNSTMASWDNPTRGLDSSSATQFVQLLRSISKETGMVNLVSMYQVSETIYDCFDKVTVLYDGWTIFCGKAIDAKEYFTRLGYECRPRQTTADFLTAITSPAERLIRKEYIGTVPTDPQGLALAFRQSPEFVKLQQEIQQYRENIGMDTDLMMRFRDDVKQTRSSWVPRTTISTSSIWKQVWTAMIRHYQLIWGDKRTFFTLIAFNILNAVINGSSYYMAPKDVSGSYEKSSALFFSLIYFYLNALTEATSTVRSRAILLKQVQYGFIHPSASVIAQTLAEIPISFFHCLLFACCYYWQIDLQQTASAFWIFVLLVFTHYSAVQSLFRMLGAWAPNVSLTLMMAGSAIPVGLLYSGFGPTRPTQHRWGSWFRRASPSPYALEALFANEFTGITLTCSDTDMVPSGAQYDDLMYQTCSIPGSEKGERSVAGATYLSDHFGYTRAHLWRNFGIILVLWLLYTIIGSIGLRIMTRESSSSQGRIFKKLKQRDIEDEAKSSASSSTDAMPAAAPINSEVQPTYSSYFAFQDVSYFVPVDGKDKQLLNSVSGYAKSGQLTALMGASGAGKTTLLDTLAQRKSEGRVAGQMSLNGKPLDASFSRTCGFVMQQDVHEPNSTVQEALLFSAHMRQPMHVPTEEKEAYVEHIIHLLDLDNISHALIGEVGDGQLSVEERKRVTIGVELAARPSSLLFLDEPTSGLDSQAAFALVEFLKRIAAEGIPIVCTIHQPSGVLFDMFDHVLLLAPGGRTVYFGETGDNSSKVVEYFGRHGAVIEQNVNPAEFIISAATAKGENALDWPSLWNGSPECQALAVSIKSTNLTAQEPANPLLSKPDAELVDRNAQYALPLWKQTTAVTKRHWISVWRDGTYNFSKVAKSLFVELFISFSFFKAGNSVQGLQNSMIAILLLSWVIPSTCADIQDMWFRKWDLFTAREKNGIYDWKALITALVAVELPWQLGTYTLIFLATYWTVGFPNDSTIAGFNYFMWLLLAIFGTTYSQLLAAMFPNPLMGGFANSLFWVILMVFSGVLTPHSYMNGFYRPWLFWTDPMRYFFGATVGTVLHDVPVACKPSELTLFEPPTNQTCGAYASSFLETASGYLVNPSATQACEYCQYSAGDNYTATLDYAYGEHWWNWAVFLGFCITNILLLYIIVWWTKGRLQRRV
ncbi:unnamed protein product [Penicillium salamii]|uniref:ABC transporter domain-containing protein n=1 Tax=Penicillium salamii TaxID=1612424 RepID=A0A9W4NPP3_9EURO|nr:unnamed protein product [Penicillium salamii]CAG8104570.1 unnamed protein product [Penicillium salamii]CAG8138716.1 unnamed protein product [Penicillium salamii]CAG8143716.1 unnamed protein product [Penicillium salamii]CAG8178918.1 unnamed protein product [Penicillium salamii]